MNTPAGGVYPRIDMSDGTYSFPAMEENVLAYWKKDGTFQASLDNRRGNEEFVFYDGPPFANGLPHYGHLLTGYVKDLIPRYQTMQGKYVDRVFGWDTHGLPAELEAERQLGITDRKQIEEMGLKAFNQYCEESVLRYTDEWEEYVTRQARWVDFENGYKTLDPGFMESVMWAFKQLYDKGLIYQGFRVLPYSWAEHTPLSNQETRLDDAYRERQDPTVTVTMPITGVKNGSNANPDLVGAHAIAWTTTPWTLPSNLALAVNPNTTYVTVRVGQGGVEGLKGERLILAKNLVDAYAKELGEDMEVLYEYPGNELVGLEYEPAFDYFKDHPQAFQIIGADYVTTEDGTGIVHQAPAFGEDDMYATAEYGIEPVIPVDLDGKFTSLVPDYEGTLVFDANRPIINALKDKGRVVRDQTIVHSYPHSWRSGEPLIYMALPAWFVRVTEIRDRMVELNHENTTWSPAHIRDGQFGKWLEGARDWNISRNRYWGAPIPVWVSDSEEYPRVDVYGSLEELERDFGKRPDSLHRPDIDDLVRPNPDDPTGRSMMHRVPEVLDCWFESGSMPFAQKHFPFENQEWFEDNDQADFVVEYNGQTRGWFYNMLVMSTALFDRVPFKNVLAHGIVLGNDGKKMSKSLGNYPNVNEVFERDGADAMRWFLMNSPILSGGNLIVTEEGIREGVRQAMLPLWNAYSFLRLYASKPAEYDTTSENILDRYIFAKLRETVEIVTAALDNNNISVATDTVRTFADVLTNWYVRRSRERFWAGDTGEDGHPEAFNTLYTVLETITRVTAPLLPMVSEVIWRGLTGKRSVHLTDWPKAGDLPQDTELVLAMDDIRKIASSASAVRKANKLRNRLPLAHMTVAQENVDAIRDFTDILRDEVNVKDVILTDDIASVGSFEVVVNARAAGPRLGKDVQRAIRGVKAGDYTVNDDGTVTVDDLTLEPEEFSLKLVAQNPDSTSEIAGTSGLVMLDTELTPELEAEGWAADRIRALQDARKNAGFDVSDRIAVTLNVPEELYDWAQLHKDSIAREVLAQEITILQDSPQEVDLADGCTAQIEKI